MSLKIDWGSLVGVHLLQIVFPTEMAVPRATLRLSPLNSALLVCDMQEKFRPSVKYFEEIVQISKRLIVAAKLLDMKIIATEQYPKGEIIKNPKVLNLTLKEYC